MTDKWQTKTVCNIVNNLQRAELEISQSTAPRRTTRCCKISQDSNHSNIQTPDSLYIAVSLSLLCYLSHSPLASVCPIAVFLSLSHCQSFSLSHPHSFSLTICLTLTVSSYISLPPPLSPSSSSHCFFSLKRLELTDVSVRTISIFQEGSRSQALFIQQSDDGSGCKAGWRE